MVLSSSFSVMLGKMCLPIFHHEIRGPLHLWKTYGIRWQGAVERKSSRDDPRQVNALRSPDLKKVWYKYHDGEGGSRKCIHSRSGIRT